MVPNDDEFLCVRVHVLIPNELRPVGVRSLTSLLQLHLKEQCTLLLIGAPVSVFAGLFYR